MKPRISKCYFGSYVQWAVDWQDYGKHRHTHCLGWLHAQEFVRKLYRLGRISR